MEPASEASLPAQRSGEFMMGAVLALRAFRLLRDAQSIEGCDDGRAVEHALCALSSYRGQLVPSLAAQLRVVQSGQFEAALTRTDGTVQLAAMMARDEDEL